MIQKIRRKLRWMWRDLLRRPMPLLDQQKGPYRVLCFHGVCPDGTAFINGRFMHLSQFKALLVILKNEAHLLSAGEFLAGTFHPERLNILLTFDDGYRNNLDLVLPVLEELELPALWFITGQKESLCMDVFDIAVAAGVDLAPLRTLLGHKEASPAEIKRFLIHANEEQVESARVWLDASIQDVRTAYHVFWQLLQDEDLKKVVEHPLITLGNHTYNHLDLTTQPAEAVYKETHKCEHRLQMAGMLSTPFLAVPYGIVNIQTLNFLQEQKEWCIFVNELNPEISEGVIARLTMNPFISLRNQVYAVYNGYY